ncbi:MAG: M50 family metallopeptidase [Chloroflexi bacterium]|nr:M50 family metallopeptidase [Chloroflexota bacterium]
METWIIAVASFVPMLLLLVVVHELGHFWSAKAFGIKVLEFGVGYPPRAFGIYTGRTETLLSPTTVCLNGVMGAIRPGQVIRVLSGENPEGQLVARYVELREAGRIGGALGSLAGLAGFGRRARSEEPGGQPARRRLDDVQTDEFLRHEGRVREVLPDRIVLADMIYTVNWLPLGGFVRLSGENNPAAPGSLARRGLGQRAIVLAAGSAMNALFPIVAFAIMFMIPHTEMVGGSAEITSVAPNSPAEAAGLMAGDRVVQVGDRSPGAPQELPREVHLAAGTEMTWVIERDGQQRVAQVTPRVDPPPGEGAVGITFSVVDQQEVRKIEPPWTAVRLGAISTWDMLTLMGREIRGWFGGGRGPELSGPIGIAQITGEVTRQGGIQGWMLVAILLSINLAVLNILPIPMLDGGRLLFVFIEWVRGGKRVPSEKEGLVHLIGFVALLALVIAISANDIMRLVRGISPLGG